MASTGVPALDNLLGGGYLDKSTILIEGPSSNEKENLAYEFIRSGLGLGDFCLYVTRLSPGDVMSDAKALGINLDKGIFWMCPEHGDRSYVPEELASISFGIKSVLKEHEARKMRVVFDLPSRLLMANPSDSVFRFLGQLLTDLKRYDAVFVATVQEDIHPPPVLAGLELVFDGVLGIKKTEHSEAEIRIKKMQGIRPLKSSISISFGAGATTELVTTQPGAGRIAVLPFVNMSPDPNDEFFADGLTEELIDRLCQVRGLEVIARTSVMAYKNKAVKAGEIGKELKVADLVEGSVRKAGDRIRVTAQLIDVKTESHLWSLRYDNEIQDIFAVQSDIAEKIAEAMKVNLIDAEKKRIERRATPVPEAYTNYLNAVYFRYKVSLGREALRKAVQYLNMATELDPNYAEAFAQLAINLAFLAVSWAEPPDQAFLRSKELADKALGLDPQNAQAYYAKSWVSYFHDMDCRAAEREGKRAVELNPNYAESRISLAYVEMALRRNEEALNYARKAVNLDPLGVYSHLVLAQVLFMLGRYDEAIVEHNKSIEIEPNSTFLHRQLGYTYLHMGKIVEGMKEMEKAVELPDGVFSKSGLGYGCAVSGKKEDALRIVAELEMAKTRGMAIAYDIALIYAGLGETSKALGFLEEAYEKRSIVYLVLFNIEPAFASLRVEPRFKSLLKKMSLEA